MFRTWNRVCVSPNWWLSHSLTLPFALGVKLNPHSVKLPLKFLILPFWHHWQKLINQIHFSYRFKNIPVLLISPAVYVIAQTLTGGICFFFHQSSSDDAKKVMRREKNRIAAQKSRMRQTQKADSLHLVRTHFSHAPERLHSYKSDYTNSSVINS